jgi:2-methylisocitrate lyase-like PEP mutase family enzyme
MRGKRVVDREEYVNKIRAAVEARAGRDFFIVARTDALAAISLEEAIARVTAARDAGADASFVEAPESLAQMAEIGKRAPKPIVANMIEKGRTPVLSRAELSKMGFDLILYPLAGIFAAAQALKEVYDKLKRDETTQGMYDKLMTFEAFNELIGVEEKYKVAERFGVRD